MGHTPVGPFETLLQNFISISIISPYFRTIHPLITEALSCKIWEDFSMPPGEILSPLVRILKRKTSYPYLSYPKISEQFVQWLLRTCPNKIWAGKKKKKKTTEQKQ